MTASNTYGKQVVVPLTNKSGGGVVLGDVVIIDTANNDAFTTTTSAATTQIVGVAAETIASNAVGRVVVGGYISLVNVNASVTRGHYGTTHTVAKQATDGGASRTAGTFCEFLTGGTTPDAMIYNTDLLGSSLTNPMNAAEDIIKGGTAGAPARLAVGAAGGALSVINSAVAWNSGTSFPASKLTGDRYWRTDLGLEFYWDGTRWLTTTLYISDIPPLNQASTQQPFPASTLITHRAVPITDKFDLWVIDFRVTIRVNTTNTGTKYQTVNLNTVGGAGTTLATLNTSAKSPDTIYQIVATAGALFGTTNILLQVQIVPTSTPGTTDVFTCQYTYRLVGT